MELTIGQRVSYPNQGVCVVEGVEEKKIGDGVMSFYLLRILSDNSTISIPTAKAGSVGIRPILDLKEFKNLINDLSEDFEDVSSDWKERSREYNEKLQSGDVFAAVDVLKKLTYLSREKKLSAREQTLLDKAKFLIISEVTGAGLESETKIETRINELIENACAKHHITQPHIMLVKNEQE
jgi:CarD family transcriptional regulator